jgi:DNA-binding transcriptional regulator YhcF (GntR family)
LAIRSRRSASDQKINARTDLRPAIPAETALSFLKDTKGILTWSLRDLTDTLKINRREAEEVIAILAAQGYVKSANERDEWMTTSAGESVSRAKPPRFARESVEQAVESLKERIKEINKEAKSVFKITEAVAFGDFLLSDRPRVQPADVGVGLARRGVAAGELQTASDARTELFLRQLRGRTALLNIRRYEDWMSKRSHLNLL